MVVGHGCDTIFPESLWFSFWFMLDVSEETTWLCAAFDAILAALPPRSVLFKRKISTLPSMVYISNFHAETREWTRAPVSQLQADEHLYNSSHRDYYNNCMWKNSWHETVGQTWQWRQKNYSAGKQLYIIYLQLTVFCFFHSDWTFILCCPCSHVFFPGLRAVISYYFNVQS